MGKDKRNADGADRHDATGDPAAQPTEAHTAEEGGTAKATAPSMSATDRFTQTDATEMHAPAIVSGPGTVPTIGFNPDTAVELRGQIAHFRVLETLGSGGFGTVVRAYDTQLDREVAVKIIRSRSLGSKQITRQFQEEARAAAQLRHPNIVTVHQSGDYGDDQVYIVYDYIRGVTLRDVLRKRPPLPAREAVTIAARIARALGYAHAKGIAHRDVKPENVLIEGDTDEPHVADFGCARRTQWDDKEEATSAKPGKANNFVGTPVYFSPEQASGRSETAAAPADVWALGVILDELLTGDRSFQEFEPNRAKLMEAIQHVEPTPIRDRSPQVDRDLAAIWQHCLHKDPKQRYATAAALADDLENWLRGFPVSVRPLNVAQRFWRWGKLNPALASSIAAVFLAVTLGFVFSTIFYYGELKSKRDNVRNSINRLYREPPDGVAAILTSLQQEYLSDVSRTLLARERQSLENQTGEMVEKKKLRIALAQFSLVASANQSSDSSAIRRELLESLLRSNPDELVLILNYLPLKQHPEDMDQLRRIADDARAGSRRRLRAICAIVKTETDEASDPEKNSQYAEQCVQFLQSELGQTTDLSIWVPLLSPLRESLRRPLEVALASGRPAVGRLLYFLYRDDLDFLIAKISVTDDRMMPDLLANLSLRWRNETGEQIWQRLIRESDAVASQLNGVSQTCATAKLWLAGLHATDDTFVDSVPILNDESNPGAAAFVASRAFAYNIPLSKLIAMLRASLERKESAAAQVYLLAISHYSPDSELQQLGELLQACQRDPDSGVHSAAAWILSRWKIETPKTAAVDAADTHRNWRIGPHQMTMIRCPDRGMPFKMGSTLDELALAGVSNKAQNQDDSEVAHRRVIPWQFEISETEVTVANYRLFIEDRTKELEAQLETAEAEENAEQIDVLDASLNNFDTIKNKLADADPMQPVTSVCLYDAAAYCIWLSQNAGLESCYGEFAGLELARQKIREIPCDLSKNGFRLPLPSEWECVCRARSETIWSFGNDESLIGEYATCSVNANDRLWAVRSRKPNRWGFFDLLGNAAEWTTSPLIPYPHAANEPFLETVDNDTTGTEERLFFEVRGGDFTQSADVVRTANRDHQTVTKPSSSVGFRLARTIETE